MNDAEGEVQKYFCNGCQQTTRHLQRTAHTKRYHDEEYDEWAECTWRVWECLGCEELMATQSWISTYEIDPRTGGPEPSVSFFPPRTSHLVKKKAYQSIPDRLDSIYAEVIQTFNTGSHILCAAGLRALLEAICVDRQPSLAGPKARLPQKIDTLKSSVSEKIVQNLHGFRFLGDKALHELEPPKPKELALAIEVIEDVLNVVYELDYKSGRLYRLVSESDRTPPRES